jgi:hypothetical protein
MSLFSYPVRKLAETTAEVRLDLGLAKKRSLQRRNAMYEEKAEKKDAIPAWASGDCGADGVFRPM